MSNKPSQTSLILPGLLGPWPAGIRREFRAELAKRPQRAEFFELLIGDKSPIKQATAGLDTELIKYFYPNAVSIKKNQRNEENGSNDASDNSDAYVRSDVSMAEIRWMSETSTAHSIATGSVPAFCADPVHMQAEMHGARVYDASVLDISDAEAAALTKSFNQLFSEDGYHWVLFNNRGYLFSEQPVDINTLPLSESTDLDLLEWGFTGADHAQFQKYATEWQMWLYQHPINQQRRRDGKLPISAIWLWGEGKSSGKSTDKALDKLRVFSQLEQPSRVFDGLIQSLSLSHHAISDIQSHTAPAQLLIDDRLLRPATALELTYWFEQLDALAAELMPLLQHTTVNQLIVPHQHTYAPRSLGQKISSRLKRLFGQSKTQRQSSTFDVIEHIEWR